MGTAWLRGSWVVGAMGVLLAGCGDFSVRPMTVRSPFQAIQQTSEETQQYVVVPEARSWVRAPESLITIERVVGADGEQRIALENNTSLRGDNFLWLRARAPGRSTAPLRLSEFLERTGGAPYPFTQIRDGDLSSGEDSLGPYVWAEQRSGVNTICVLGLRRITQAGRVMPQGTTVIDVMMRNCVEGTPAQALAPLRDERLAYFPATSGNLRASGNRNLSPLAAPLP
ncbi:hypothetical protein [Halodurantibacterium flavum]|uniref:Lipoprotein n=1 Tax=Halodurantibacterium flavum TaxID=1382802 RepID=A0ABW4S6P7_9RHOB